MVADMIDHKKHATTDGLLKTKMNFNFFLVAGASQLRTCSNCLASRSLIRKAMSHSFGTALYRESSR